MARYMKGQFAFFGIKTPQRKALVKEQVDELGRPTDWPALGKLLWEAPQREMQYAFNDLLEPVIRKQSPALLNLLEELIQRKSWWDTVDFLAPRLAGRLLMQNPGLLPDYPDRWITHDNFWLQRAAILCQLRWKAQTDEKRLFNYIQRRAESSEFFVQKGAGWALREYSKVNPEAVQTFVQATDLPALTVREGLKWVLRKKK